MTKHILDRRNALRGLGGLGVTMLFGSQTVFARAPSPEHIVANFHHSLLSVMQEATVLGYNGRFKRLRPYIEEIFHLPVMLRIAMGDFWLKASISQQISLVKVFTDISAGTYAARFSGYTGQLFMINGSRPGPQKTILVDTVLENPSGSNVPITYVTREIQGSWRIIDILLSTGISELAIRRSEYRRILRAEGIEGLISALTAKVRDLSSSN